MTGRAVGSVVLVIAAVATLGSTAAAKGGPQMLTDREEVVYRTNGEDVTLRLVTGQGESDQLVCATARGACRSVACRSGRGTWRRRPVSRWAKGRSTSSVAVTSPSSSCRGAASGASSTTRCRGSWSRSRPRSRWRGRRGVHERVPRLGRAPGRPSLSSRPPVDDPSATLGGLGQARIVARDADGVRLGRVLVRRDMSWPSAAAECEVGSLPQRFPKPTGRSAGRQCRRAGPRDRGVHGAAVRWHEFLTATGWVSVEDGDAVRDVVRIATERYPDYAGKISAHVAEVRFVDTDEAAVRFSLDVPGLGPGIIPGGIGTGVLRGERSVARRAHDVLHDARAQRGVLVPSARTRRSSPDPGRRPARSPG